MADQPQFEFIQVEVQNKVAHLRLNRPDKANALSLQFWKEVELAFGWVHDQTDVRVAILSGNGKHFCAGIDLEDFGGVLNQEFECEARRRDALRKLILGLQYAFTAIEKCRVPVIAAIHGSCIGGGIDMITACDMRYATKDARFSVKEVDLGITADVGTLQRLPHLVGDGIARELCFTARDFDGNEAKEIKLVNQIYEDRESLMEHVELIAGKIAAKSPLAVRGTKEILVYTRDHNVEDSLRYVAAWNSALLISNDLVESITAQFEGRLPEYQD